MKAHFGMGYLHDAQGLADTDRSEQKAGKADMVGRHLKNRFYLVSYASLFKSNQTKEKQNITK